MIRITSAQAAEWGGIDKVRADHPDAVWEVSDAPFSCPCCDGTCDEDADAETGDERRRS